MPTITDQKDRAEKLVMLKVEVTHKCRLIGQSNCSFLDVTYTAGEVPYRLRYCIQCWLGCLVDENGEYLLLSDVQRFYIALERFLGLSMVMLL